MMITPNRNRVPPGVLAIAAELRSAGGQAWIVGGAVRDLLLARPINDWDLATDLTPEVVASLFRRTVEIGIRFGTVRVLYRDADCEVTTFRRDGLYTDARRPDEVSFTHSLDEDLVRRDFTINALAWDPVDGRLEDPTGGQADLDARLIRAVGDPVERFTEDGLRLLRAVRFAAQLDFDLESGTYRALLLCAPRIERISPERVRLELDRLLQAPRPSAALAVLHETGLLRRVLPELAACYGVTQNAHHAYDVFHHTLAAVDAAPPTRRLVRLAALFHDAGKPRTRGEKLGVTTFYAHQSAGRRLVDSAFRRLRYPNEDRERVGHLVQHHMFHYRPEWTDAAVRRFLREVGDEHLDDLFALRAADSAGNGTRRGATPELDELRRRIAIEVERRSALTVRDLTVNGHDLMHELLIMPGPELGRILRALLEEVLDDPQRNKRETLLGRARAIHAGGPHADPDADTGPGPRRPATESGARSEELPHSEGE
jgi:poly(A) polymerase/tRNA nucleotidyltransferase (CCA-adding enzyme)